MIIQKTALLAGLCLSVFSAQAQILSAAPQRSGLAEQTQEPQDKEAGGKPMIIAAANHIVMNDYNWIESKRAALLASQELDSDGEPQLIWFYYGVAYGLALRPLDDDAEWRSVNQAIDRWEKRRPQSITAKLARIHMRIKRAGDIRGYGFEHETAQSKMDQFTEEMLTARKELIALPKAAKNDPYFLLLQGESTLPFRGRAEEIGAIMEYSAKRYPAYHQILSSGVMYHMPKWHGDAESLERYARRVSEAAPAQYKEIIYAKVYFAASVQGSPRALFRKTKADWPTIKAGWEKIIAKHPSQRNIQSFIKMACLAPDKAVAKALFQQRDITVPFMEQLWERQNFGGCWHWSYQP